MKNNSCFDKIIVPDASRLIIRQIFEKVRSGELNGGERLPSETALQKIFEVSRPQLRAAFKRLAEHGIVETRPQSGTYMAPFGAKILEGLLTSVLQGEDERNDPLSLADTRRLIEVHAARLAASRMTGQQMKGIREAHKVFRRFKGQARATDDDFYFHLLIVSASGSSVLNAQYCALIPRMIRFWSRLERLNEEEMKRRSDEACGEHELLLRALEEGDPEQAARAMKAHLDRSYDFAEVLRSK